MCLAGRCDKVQMLVAANCVHRIYVSQHNVSTNMAGHCLIAVALHLTLIYSGAVSHTHQAWSTKSYRHDMVGRRQVGTSTSCTTRSTPASTFVPAVILCTMLQILCKCRWSNVCTGWLHESATHLQQSCKNDCPVDNDHTSQFVTRHWQALLHSVCMLKTDAT